MSGKNYEFRVRGRISEQVRRRVDEFSEMRVVPAPPETLIQGTATDQAHLNGLLVLLEALGLHVVSVQEIPPLPDDPE
jgi:hypothetical protein